MSWLKSHQLHNWCHPVSISWYNCTICQYWDYLILMLSWHPPLGQISRILHYIQGSLENLKLYARSLGPMLCILKTIQAYLSVPNILAIDNLMRRERTMVNSCYLCKKSTESCSHILLWCQVVYELWTMMYNLIDIKWVIAGSVREELWAWKGLV